MRVIDLLEDYDLLIESFSSIAKKFKENGIDDSLVDTYIDKFKALSKRNAITGKERDIGYWYNKSWDPFQEFIDTKESIPSKRQAKRQIKKDVITVLDNKDWSVIIPLTKEAAKIYGSNTKWCTTVERPNNFFRTYITSNILYYIFDKKNNTKYAVLFDLKNMAIGYILDGLDHEITELPGGFKEDQFDEWSRKYKDRILSFYIPILASDSNSSYLFAQNTRKPFPEGEKSISGDAWDSTQYAKIILGGRFPAGEKIISSDGECSLEYARDVIKGKFPIGEVSISKDADISFDYAKDVLKGRFPEGEEAILRSKYAEKYRELFLTGK